MPNSYSLHYQSPLIKWYFLWPNSYIFKSEVNTSPLLIQCLPKYKFKISFLMLSWWLEPRIIQSKHKPSPIHITSSQVNPLPRLHLTQHPFLHMKSATLSKVHRGELGSCCSPSQGAVLAHTRHYKSAFLADTSYVPHPLHIPLRIHGCFGGENFLTDSRKEMSWHLGRFFIHWWWSRGELREL